MQYIFFVREAPSHSNTLQMNEWAEPRHNPDG